jgi:hypothetical protein
VPQAPERRLAWERAAGVLAGCRELAGLPEQQLDLGRQPAREQVLHRTMWQQAHRAVAAPTAIATTYVFELLLVVGRACQRHPKLEQVSARQVLVNVAAVAGSVRLATPRRGQLERGRAGPCGAAC